MFTRAMTGVRWLAVALLAGLVAACGTVPPASTGPDSSNRPPGSEAPTSPGAKPSDQEPPESDAPGGPVELNANVEDDADGVNVDTVIKATAKYGTLSTVTLEHGGTGSPKMDVPKVTGTLNGEKTTWTAGSGLDPAATYTLKITGANAAGEEKTETITFTTKAVAKSKQTFVNIYPKDGHRVGVGMPAVLTFDVPVKDKAAFEKQLKVTSVPAQEGSWNWFSDQEVHYRPKTYWKPGTKITVTANLNGINAGNGIYGQNSSSKTYSVGRSVITKVDLKAKQAVIEIDGKKAKTIPISAGKKGFITRSGAKVIMEKLDRTRMASETVGISENSSEGYNMMVKFAMRITQSGEFIHAAPWNAGNMGKVNASHGCTGMATDDAYWLFQRADVGSPVITTGSDRETEWGNGWTDWDVSWEKYQQGSAL
ncbi:L,D-transpeptidase [Microlunatus parietis]|uniref:Lipoprotein-anchoring transpeptidase ErfK/SrfK n=1 Tax=Microlunatus parietis TaxID=682979 RepID=A0A7Y9I5C9_9ACTN|nr:Ig-like domain-containing protein [Microlunatus parietis]NYE70403.1 lipoprotein-anchoring transpeptidase ErfK/SrfK [Microlunatus parietis]